MYVIHCVSLVDNPTTLLPSGIETILSLGGNLFDTNQPLIAASFVVFGA